MVISADSDIETIARRQDADLRGKNWCAYVDEIVDAELSSEVKQVLRAQAFADNRKKPIAMLTDNETLADEHNQGACRGTVPDRGRDRFWSVLESFGNFAEREDIPFHDVASDVAEIIRQSSVRIPSSVNEQEIGTRFIRTNRRWQ